MSNIIKIGGVRGFIDENGVAQLNAEDVARGWGFVQKQVKNGKTYESVRWERVHDYLREFGFPPLVGENSKLVGKDDFLPENMVYRLGFKASNETAQAFQAKLADEILPTIRKTGSYSVKPAPVLPDFTNPVIAARAWADEVEKKQLAEAQVKEMAPKALFADAVSASKTSILIGELAKLLCQNGINIGQKRLFAWLREHGWLIKGGSAKNTPTQKGVEMGLFEIKVGSYVNGEGVNITTKTTKVTGKGQVYFVNKFLKKDAAEY